MDPIANMLTQIRNAQAVNHRFCVVRFSKIKEEMLRILREEKYIKDYKTEEKDGKKNIRVSLSYIEDQVPVIRSIKRISKPGRRVYISSKRFIPVLKGLGMEIISTSKGLMTNKKARKEGLGGEVICRIY